MITALHQSVMPNEVLAALSVHPGSWYIDATFGRGGHTQTILSSGGNVIAFDWDSEAIAFGQSEFAAELAKNKLILIHDSFALMQDKLDQLKRNNSDLEIAGILFDFGTSTDQLKSTERGFSFSGNQELDMRMDTRLGVKAKDLLGLLSEKQLTEVFSVYGGEHKAYSIAKSIVRFREKEGRAPATTEELVNIVQRVYPYRTSHLHPATKVFQALRIIVNSELEAIEAALPQALSILKKAGHIVTIAFHEGEDRIVKHYFRAWEEAHLGHSETKKPLAASEVELTANPNARSAKLRVFRKN